MKLLFAMMLATSIYAQSSLTTVSGTVANADGTPFTGRVTITAQPVRSGGVLVRSAPIQLCTIAAAGCPAVIVNGVVTVRLTPNDTETPSTSSYFVTYQPSRGNAYSEYWRIPTGGPFTIAQVIISGPTIPTVMINPSQLSGSGFTSGQGICWSGTAFIPGQCNSGATWGALTGALSDQTDLFTVLSQKQATITGAPGTWPSFATVATSGAYADLTGKPTIPTVPTNVSAFTNDSGYLTSASSLSWVKLTGVPSTFAPSAHASSHQNGGSDEIATATAAANAIPKAGAGGTLAAAWIPTLNQNTTGSAASLSAAYIDWNASSGGASLLNKPSIPAASSTTPVIDGTAAIGTGTTYARADHVHPTDTSRQSTITGAPGTWPSFATVATSGAYADLTGKPTIPAAQVNSDWNAVSGLAQILNKPSTWAWGSLTGIPSTFTPSAHASTHASGGSDPVTLAESQITNLTTDLAAKAPLSSPTFTGSVAIGTSTLSGTASMGLQLGSTNGLSFPASDTNSVAVGDRALASVTTGLNNDSLGWRSCFNVVSGSYNDCFGHDAGFAIGTTGHDNTFVGEGAGFGNGVGNNNVNYNVGIGSTALLNTINANNTAVGFAALRNATDTNQNTAVGASACTSLTTGSQATCLGSQADVSATTTNAIAIGSGASATTSNTAVIGNSSVTDIYFGGTGGAAKLHFSPVGVTLTESQITNLTTDLAGKQASLGYTPLNPANNLSEVTAATARSNLGLVIGTNVLAPTGSAASLTGFPTLNQNTTGTAAGLTSAYIDWNASSGGAFIQNKPASFTPSAHASTHASGGSDAVTLAESQVTSLTTDLAAKAALASGNTFTSTNIFKGTSASDAASLGSELTSSSGWTSTNWTGSYGAGFTHTTGNTSALSTSMTVTSSAFYQVVVTVASQTAGTLTVTIGGASVVAITANGTYTNGPKTTSTGAFTLTPDTNFNGTVTVSVKLITALTPGFTGQDSTGAASWALLRQTASLNNLYLGVNSGIYNTTGSSNAALGTNALGSNTTGGSNMAIGVNALLNNTTGSANVALGQGTLISSATATNNVAAGQSAMYSTTTGSYNAVLGTTALYSNTTGSNNTAVGQSALTSNTTGSNNVALGYLAGYSNGTNANVSGGNNTWLGYGTGPGSTTQYNYQTAVGSGATASCSNCVVLGRAGDVMQIPATTYSSLPSCVSGLEGSMKPLTDSTQSVSGATIAGGGAFHVVAYCDGSNWIVGMRSGAVPECIAWSTGTINSAANNVHTYFNFDTHDSTCTSGMHSTSTNTSQIKITVAGLYQVSCRVLFGGSTGGYMYVFTKANGDASTEEAVGGVATGMSSPYLQIQTLHTYAVNDYLECGGAQGSGGSLAPANGAHGTLFSAYQVR